MSKKIVLAGLFLAVLAALPGRASAGAFSEEEKALLNKSSKGTFTEEEAARLKKKSDASFSEDESKLLNKSAAGAFSDEEAALLNKKPKSAVTRSYGSQGGSMGIELTGSYWSLSDDSFKEKCFDGECMDWVDSGKSDQGSIGIGAALFFEGGSDIKAGFSLGYNMFPSGKYNNDSIGVKRTYENSAYSIPATLYFKIRQSEQINITGGVSADYIKAEVKYKRETLTTITKETYTGTRLVPGASLGAEMFPVKNISVMLGLKYMFFGSVTNFENKDGDPVFMYRYSFSGLRINAAARYYFGG